MIIGQLLKNDQPFDLTQLRVATASKLDTLKALINLIEGKNVNDISLGFLIKGEVSLGPPIANIECDEDSLHIRAFSDPFVVTVAGIVCRGIVLLLAGHVVIGRSRWVESEAWKIGQHVRAEIELFVGES